MLTSADAIALTKLIALEIFRSISLPRVRALQPGAPLSPKNAAEDADDGEEGAEEDDDDPEAGERTGGRRARMPTTARAIPATSVVA